VFPCLALVELNIEALNDAMMLHFAIASTPAVVACLASSLSPRCSKGWTLLAVAGAPLEAASLLARP